MRQLATRPWVRLLIAPAIAALAAILFWFDPSQHAFYPRCWLHQTTGLLCPGCGALRALHQLLHGHLFAAFRFNPLLILCLPLVLGWAGLFAWRRWQGRPFNLQVPPLWLWLGLVLVLAFGVWRNLPGSPFAQLPP